MNEEDKEKELPEKNKFDKEIEKLPKNENEEIEEENISTNNNGEINLIQGVYTGIQLFAEGLAKISSIIKSDTTQAIIKIVKNTVDAWSSIDFTPLITAAKSVLNDIVSPEISEERKKELQEYHEEWGKLGWTYLISSKFYFFDEAPKSEKEAHAKMMSFCTKQEIEKVFLFLRKARINKDDIESAIFCYEHRKYKACACILFGLLERKLLKIQGRNQVNRKVGKKAVNYFRGKAKIKSRKEMLFETLYRLNVLACLDQFFADGNNFKNEPNTINRNFLMHGMTNRPVRKRDCLQLFLLLNNVLLLMNQ